MRWGSKRDCLSSCGSNKMSGTLAQPLTFILSPYEGERARCAVAKRRRVRARSYSLIEFGTKCPPRALSLVGSARCVDRGRRGYLFSVRVLSWFASPFLKGRGFKVRDYFFACSRIEQQSAANAVRLLTLPLSSSEEERKTRTPNRRPNSCKLTLNRYRRGAPSLPT
jgi:hypothetical protein